jgi:betaine lipid synthase
LDRIEYVLSPEDGVLGVVDFYTSGKQPSLHEKAIGGTSKECGWLSRWFWQIWFDFDHVSLSPHRRDYLEYRFGTVSSFSVSSDLFPTDSTRLHIVSSRHLDQELQRS